ncbi:MAG: NAD-dependent epimerase/dehydratase family protein [Methylocystis sp.]|uniref:NAD-dependent epimerase/dehydratase family protein n=1 Tax=Methylocystis sp. TaxID=1911079 RepID=UPI003DA310D9
MPAYQRILLTGGGGFVGSHVAGALSEAYPDAFRVMLMRPEEKGAHPAFSATAVDLLDEAAIDRLVADLVPDLVVHLAGQASVGQSAGAPEATWRANFHGAFGLGAALGRHAPEAVVLFSSTAAAYGASFLNGAANEDTPLRPLDVYSRSKVAAEAALSDVLGPRARLIVARPVNHSGPGQRSRNFVLASFAAQIAAIEAGQAPPRLEVGDLSRLRDFLDVRDVVDAYMRLIAQADALPARGVFNIGSGEAHSIAELLDLLRGLARRDFDVVVDPERLRPAGTDIACVRCDASRLRAATGWRPRFTMTDMLGALLDQWRAEYAGGSP